jgi:hypothetical protein
MSNKRDAVGHALSLRIHRLIEWYCHLGELYRTLVCNVALMEYSNCQNDINHHNGIHAYAC